MSRWVFRAVGDWALWTPAAIRAERYSQLVGSHDAWVGLLRGVLGHKGMTWNIREVHILRPPRYLGLTQNELKFDGAGPYDRSVQHTQRRTTLLRDVGYLIVADLVLSPDATSEDSIRKYNEMCEIRLENGQQRRQTYFGIRECMALVERHEGRFPKAVDLTQDLGICYYGTDFYADGWPQYYAPLQVDRGIVHYPTWDEVRKLGIKRERAA